MGVGAQRSGQSASAPAGAVAPDPLGTVPHARLLHLAAFAVSLALGILVVHRYGKTR